MSYAKASIVIFSYGGDRYAKQALLCAASVCSRNPQCRVSVYTDSPDCFSQLPVTLVPLTKRAVAEMQGPLFFRHRVKIQVLLKHVRRFQSAGPICYLDADCFCSESFDGKFGADSLMHAFDGNLGPKFHTRFFNFLCANRTLLDSAGYIDLLENLSVFNAGLIYLPPGQNLEKILRDVLQLTDFLCLWFPQQMEWLEQMAFSYCLPRNFTLKADPCGVIHYWQHNEEVAVRLASMTDTEIIALGNDLKRFENLRVSGSELQKRETHRWQQRIAKLRRSFKKRLLTIRAVQLRMMLRGERPAWS